MRKQICIQSCFRLIYADTQMGMSATIQKSRTQLDLKLNPPDETQVNKVLPDDSKDQKVLRLTCLVLSADQIQT